MQISYNGWTSYVTNNYFYSHIPLEGLLCGAESDLLATATFLVIIISPVVPICTE